MKPDWVLIDSTAAWVNWKMAVLTAWPDGRKMLKKPPHLPVLVPKAPWLHTGAKPCLPYVDIDDAQKLLGGMPEIEEDE